MTKKDDHDAASTPFRPTYGRVRQPRDDGLRLEPGPAVHQLPDDEVDAGGEEEEAGGGGRAAERTPRPYPHAEAGS